MGRTVINETENKQTVILNDSAEGVSGGYFDKDMIWKELGEKHDSLYDTTVGMRTYGASISNNSVLLTPNGLGWANYFSPYYATKSVGEVKDRKIHLAFDYTISGIAEGGSISGGFCTFNGRSGNSSARVVVFDTIDKIDENLKRNGSCRFDFVSDYADLSIQEGTPNDSQYFSFMLFAHTGANSRVEISNIVFEVI